MLEVEFSYVTIADFIIPIEIRSGAETEGGGPAFLAAGERSIADVTDLMRTSIHCRCNM